MSEPELLHIGYGAGFAGDRPDAAIALAHDLAERPGPRYLAFELLAERTLAETQQRRLADPEQGYAERLFDFLDPVLPICLPAGIPIITNGGAAHPVAAARRLRATLERIGHGGARIACVLGDDLQDALDPHHPPAWLPREVPFEDIVSCHVYIGAESVTRALEEGADVVICGRIADPSMAVGAIRHAFGWSATDWQRTAIALATGHLLECCTQVTGGYFADPGFKDVPDPAHPGCPIVELKRSGELVVTKTAGSGGVVNARTVREQLLYEIHDPGAYLTPDGVLDLNEVTVIDHGNDRVEVTGIRGHPAPDTLKGNLGLGGLWFGEAGISYAGPNALARARLARDILLERSREQCPQLSPRIDLIGVCSVLGDDRGEALEQTMAEGATGTDVRVRLGVVDRDRAAIARLLQEVEALYTNGPAGGGGVRKRLGESLRTSAFTIDRTLVSTTLRWF
ncbi:acyclic terpene utilization AtuA family protein [Kushneria phosphatilytica]|nr:acyclic terpene utilization AtuA family protein [Kushneria phosphatilytica]